LAITTGRRGRSDGDNVETQTQAEGRCDEEAATALASLSRAGRTRTAATAGASPRHLTTQRMTMTVSLPLHCCSGGSRARSSQGWPRCLVALAMAGFAPHRAALDRTAAQLRAHARMLTLRASSSERDFASHPISAAGLQH
jgi:hypothetical protein